MSTTTVTFTIASDADDGSIWRDGGSWPPTGSYHVDDGDDAYAAKGSIYANVALFRFNTSSIPDGATITEATFRPKVHHADVIGGTYNLVGDYYDFGGEPSDSSDWTLECSPTIFTGIDISTIDGDAYIDIPLTNLSGINKSGYTGIRCSLDNSAATPSGDNHVAFYTHEAHIAAGTTPATLFVVYTESTTTQLTAGHGSGMGHW